MNWVACIETTRQLDKCWWRVISYYRCYTLCAFKKHSERFYQSSSNQGMRWRRRDIKTNNSVHACQQKLMTSIHLLHMCHVINIISFTTERHRCVCFCCSDGLFYVWKRIQGGRSLVSNANVIAFWRMASTYICNSMVKSVGIYRKWGRDILSVDGLTHFIFVTVVMLLYKAYFEWQWCPCWAHV